MFKFGLGAATAAVILGLTSGALADFTLTSSQIAEGQPMSEAQVFQGFGCDGANRAPDLAWSGAPEGTKSFAVLMYDPDAPTGSGWWHWFVVNVPADATGLPAGGAVPEGATVLKNDFGTTEFGGACPPPGEMHRYQFTVHALGTTLDLDSEASNALAGYMVKANSLASATITAVYTR